jgi:hypothetical protein
MNQPKSRVKYSIDPNALNGSKGEHISFLEFYFLILKDFR